MLLSLEREDDETVILILEYLKSQRIDFQLGGTAGFTYFWIVDGVVGSGRSSSLNTLLNQLQLNLQPF